MWVYKWLERLQCICVIKKSSFPSAPIPNVNTEMKIWDVIMNDNSRGYVSLYMLPGCFISIYELDIYCILAYEWFHILWYSSKLLSTPIIDIGVKVDMSDFEHSWKWSHHIKTLGHDKCWYNTIIHNSRFHVPGFMDE